MNEPRWEILIQVIDGVVRPLVTLMLAAGLLWGFITEKVSSEAYLGIVAAIIAFWFRERQDKAIMQQQTELVKQIHNNHESS